MMPLKTDCRFFRGDVPCAPHKAHGVHCVDARGADCQHYEPTDSRILIIKLGAIGDVIRTTPLLRKLKEIHPRARITWLTRSPFVLPAIVDEILPFTLESIVTLRSTHFDILFSLDKDRESCALASELSATKKMGFILKDGIPAPANEEAEKKFLTGIFDDVSKSNRTSYVEETFEMCGFVFGGERYSMCTPSTDVPPWKLTSRKRIVGLNTGCGERWTSRLWSDSNWVQVAKGLKKKGYEVILLGGEAEHTRNKKLATRAGVKYFGHFPLQEFIGLVNRCHLVVTAVTMALHIAIGLEKHVVLLNNIFNRHEFDLYGLGEILEPDRSCQCFYQPTCTNDAYRCMDTLPSQKVIDSCVRILKV
jgi:ADP-heptose:LPS heptosyltransferase